MGCCNMGSNGTCEVCNHHYTAHYTSVTITNKEIDDVEHKIDHRINEKRLCDLVKELEIERNESEQKQLRIFLDIHKKITAYEELITTLIN